MISDPALACTSRDVSPEDDKTRSRISKTRKTGDESRVAVACTCCVRAKMRCSNQRPCERCIRRSQEHLCVDRDPKRNDGFEKKKRRKQVPTACVPCSVSKTACESQRPCRRCVRRNETHLCIDRVRSRTRRVRDVNESDLQASLLGSVHSNTIDAPDVTLASATAAGQDLSSSPSNAVMLTTSPSPSGSGGAAIPTHTVFSTMPPNSPHNPPNAFPVLESDGQRQTPAAFTSSSSMPIAIPNAPGGFRQLPNAPAQCPSPLLRSGGMKCSPDIRFQSSPHAPSAMPPIYMSSPRLMPTPISHNMYPPFASISPMPAPIGQLPHTPPLQMLPNVQTGGMELGFATSTPCLNPHIVITQAIVNLWRFGHNRYASSIFRDLMRCRLRWTFFMSAAMECLSEQDIKALRSDMIMSCLHANSADYNELATLDRTPMPSFFLRYEVAPMVLESVGGTSSSSPHLVIGNDDLLRIAFWESQCAVIRVNVSQSTTPTGYHILYSISLNDVAKKLWGYTHEELNQAAQIFTPLPYEFYLEKIGKPVPFLWRFFSQRSFEAISISMLDRHMQNLSQLRIDLEIVCKNGLQIPCRSYWKYRALGTGAISDVLIAVKPF